MRRRLTQRTELIAIKDIRPGPIRGPLTAEQERRIRAFTDALQEVFPCKYEDAYDSFRRDMHPDREIVIWEHIAKTYKAHVAGYKTFEGRKALYTSILTTGRPPAS